jgi:hypothetical protein
MNEVDMGGLDVGGLQMTKDREKLQTLIPAMVNGKRLR